jgi:hypothetical protein
MNVLGWCTVFPNYIALIGKMITKQEYLFHWSGFANTAVRNLEQLISADNYLSLLTSGKKKSS